MRFRAALPLPVLLLLGSTLVGQPTSEPKDSKPKEEGIPVTDALTVAKCGACHKQDEKGAMTRISWERATPEGWEQAIKRMVRLNGVSLTPEEARKIVKYLGTNHGLAPEEARPAMYIAERRMVDEKEPNEAVRTACMVCHPLGRAMAWRRSKEEWDLLGNMHLGYFAVADFQGFRRPPPPPDAPPPAPGTDTRQPVEQALDYLTKTYPLRTPEWAAWRARMRAPKLAGRWLISGKQIGRGQIYGEMLVEPGAAEDEFTTSITLHYIKDGSTAKHTGRALVYTGYAWRGRSQPADGASDPQMRQVMMVSADQSQMEGRWFRGAYDEFGLDLTLRRAGAEPALVALDCTALRTGTAGRRVRLFGDSLPSGLTPAEIDFGSGVSVKRVVSQSAREIAVEVDVAPGPAVIAGKRDVAVRRAVLPNAYAVYDKVDYIKVVPETSLARLGGNTHPKGYQQFEAVAFHRGPDNKAKTDDDVDLGPVDVEWSIEEFLAVQGDDDKDFVGSLSASGLFTPASEGPNPKRKFSRNNYGDVWVVASYKPRDGEPSDSKPVTARSYLVVTVPLYVRWDQPEVAQ